jgi:hypothetical protein
VTVSVFAGASTYALGEVFKKHFSSGGTILDFDPGRLKKMYKEKFEKGKKVAEKWREEQKAQKAAEAEESAPEMDPTITVEQDADDAPVDNAAVLKRLKELASLRDQGIISEKEFEKMKKKLIDSF